MASALARRVPLTLSSIRLLSPVARAAESPRRRGGRVSRRGRRLRYSHVYRAASSLSSFPHSA